MTIYLAFLNLHFDDLQFEPSFKCFNVIILRAQFKNFFKTKTGPYKTLCEHSDCKREKKSALFMCKR